jgi:hypothetical protein
MREDYTVEDYRYTTILYLGHYMYLYLILIVWEKISDFSLNSIHFLYIQAEKKKILNGPEQLYLSSKSAQILTVKL